MILLEAFVEGLIKEILEKPNEGSLKSEDYFVIGTGLIIIQIIGDKIFKSGDNSEVAKLMRDPTRRPEQIIRNWRDKIMDKDSGNEIVKVIGPPVREVARAGKKVEKEIRRAFRKPW